METYIEKLKSTMMLWVTSHISPDSNAFRELRDTDCLIQNKSGGIRCSMLLLNVKPPLTQQTNRWNKHRDGKAFYKEQKAKNYDTMDPIGSLLQQLMDSHRGNEKTCGKDYDILLFF